MKKKAEDIIFEFDKKILTLNSFRENSELLIKSLLNLESIEPHLINSRLKEKNSLEKKIIKKNYKYSCLEDITDIVGIRVIVYFEDEVDKVADLIEKEFDIDKENSIDKRIISEDKFGYRSLHYVASYKKDRLKLKEYSVFKNLKFEIQIRTILQHSWAEIEHDLGYKGENEIPSSAKRTFYRVAALLEQADIEFVKLKDTISEYEQNVGEQIKDSPSKVSLDKASLKSFLYNNLVVREVEDQIAKANGGLEILEDDDDSKILITETNISNLKKLGVQNINDLEKFYIKYKDDFIKYEIDRISENENAIGFIKGATINWIIDFADKK